MTQSKTTVQEGTTEESIELNRAIPEAAITSNAVLGLIIVLATSCLALACITSQDDTNASSRPINLQLDLNSSSEAELSLIPGIGPVTARRIIENRNRLGYFESVDSVVRVRGVGPETLKEIRTLCFVREGSIAGRVAGRALGDEPPRR